MARRQTPSQTVGPFFAYALTPQEHGYDLASIAGPVLAGPDTEGERMRLVGRVFDGEGRPVEDALIELWQADAHGRYNHPADARRNGVPNASFTGFGRCGTGADPSSRYLFDTVKPGSVGDGQAPHLNLIVFLRGLLNHVYTRVYFSDEAAANAVDPVLSAVPADRRRTLIAERETTPDGIVYRFDIHMQGDRETVFFDA